MKQKVRRYILYGFSKFVFLLLVYCLLPASSKAQNDLLLAEAIKTGLENNYQIRIYKKNVEIAQNNNSWGTVGRFPAITAGFNQSNRYDEAPNRVDPDITDKYSTNMVYPNVNLQWNLFSGFAVSIAKDKLELLEKFTEGNAAVVIENTIQGIVLAYYRVLLEEEKLKVLSEVKKVSGDRYNYIMQRKELGGAVTYDVLQAKNAFLSDSSNFLLEQLNVKNAFLNLHLLLGTSPDVKYKLTDKFEIGNQEIVLDVMMKKMKANNKTLQNQFINLEILKKEISYRKSAVYPNVGFRAGYDYMNNRIKYSGSSASASDNFDYYANFSISFNLFNGGNTRRAIKNSRIEERVGQLSIAEMEHGLTNQLINLFELYAIQKQLYNVALANVESTGLNLQISEQKFKAGAINSFNYRDVQLMYLNASLNKLQAIYNLIDTDMELMRITGSVISEY